MPQKCKILPQRCKILPQRRKPLLQSCKLLVQRCKLFLRDANFTSEMQTFVSKIQTSAQKMQKFFKIKISQKSHKCQVNNLILPNFQVHDNFPHTKLHLTLQTSLWNLREIFFSAQTSSGINPKADKKRQQHFY